MKNEIKNQPVIREQSYRILVDKPLLDFLRPRTEGKFSKQDAYCFLLDKAMAEAENPQMQDVHKDSNKKWTLKPFEVTVTDLAKTWNWHRATTRKFLNELAEMGMLKKEALQKSCIIQMCISASKTHGDSVLTADNISTQIAALISGTMPLNKACLLFGQLTACNNTATNGRQSDVDGAVSNMPYGIIHHMLLWQLHDLPTGHQTDNDVIPILHELYTIHHKGEWSTLLERLTDFSAVLHGDILPSRHPSFDGIPNDEATLLDRMFRYYRNLLSKDR